MTALLLTLVMSACALDDTACWRGMALEQSERAERAEQRASLEKSAKEIVQTMVRDEAKRADRWAETARAIAPKQPMFFETPSFWLAIGFVAGGALVVGTAYAVKPALFQLQ